MTLGYKKLIEKYDLNFQLYINEKEKIPIFKKINLKDKILTLDEFQGSLIDVIKTSNINDKYYHYIQYEGNTLGWCRPEDSLMVFRAKKEEIRLKDNIDVNNEVNDKIDIDLEMFEKYQKKILSTDLFLLYRGKIYYGIKLKDELLGFIDVENIYFFHNYRKDFKFIKEDVNLYKDSRLEKPIIENFAHQHGSSRLFGIFEELDVARVIINDKKYWININDTDVPPIYKNEPTVDEMILEALLYQLNDKLHKQQVFASRKISKLETEIKSLKENEKSAKNSLKEIEGLLKNSK